MLKLLENDCKNICGISDELKKCYIYNVFLNCDDSIVVLCDTLFCATSMYNGLKNYTQDVLFFPMDDYLISDVLACSPELLVSRIETLIELSKKSIIVLNLMGYLKLLPSPDNFKNSFLDIKIGECYNISDLKNKLFDIGYDVCTTVNKSGEMAIRGYVLDVFVIGMENPYRIEFFGDEVFSINLFNVNTQLRIDECKEIKIIPSKLDGNDCNILNYLTNCKVFYNEYENLVNFNEELKELFADSNIDAIDSYSSSFLNIVNCDTVNLSVFDSKFSEEKFNFGSLNVDVDFTNFDTTILQLGKYLSKYKKVIICVSNRYQYEKIVNTFSMYKVILTDIEKIVEGILNICIMSITDSFIYDEMIFISETDIFNKKVKHSHFKSKFKQGTKIFDIGKLNIGDYVVHITYGIAKYLGLKTILKNGLKKDYLHLEYSNNDKLYVPVEKIELISKYGGSDGYRCKLSSLSSNDWAKSKYRAMNRARELAIDLLNLYAIREMKEGYSFLPDCDMQFDFESEFPYQETEDQLKVISEIKKDMESNHPMDRLLCGDVGYGKTEIAFRAAFKCVLSGKQVAILCPTTILSSQHFNNALLRFKSFAVSIQMLNRFTSVKNEKEILTSVLNGKIDILIGTHKILNDKVIYKDLGLLIIDEEQRFGVKHKELIKNYKQNIDVLTLSATPIPRTLNMSLSGLRDLSTIETPPVNRYPIQTYVLGIDYKVIKDVIKRELSRGGQAFVLHNNISDITTVCEKLANLLPNVSIKYAHGRMDKNELEDLMIDFNNNEFSVLVCTTIIETGIDIPNVNTLIILDADKLGLSQLYQLRGRVGRSELIAYCYLMYDPGKILNDIAKKRLNAIKEFTELGSGLSIAMRDLSIRGAGDLLGSDQAGFIDAVGIELFTRMLRDEINKLKGIQKDDENINESNLTLIEVETTVDDTYILEQELKIEVHKMINNVDSIETLNEVKFIIEDRFGKMNETLIIYMYEEWFSKLCYDLEIIKVVQNVNLVEIYLEEKLVNNLNGDVLFLAMLSINKKFRFTQKFRRVIISLSLKSLEKHFIYYLVDLLLAVKKSLKM